MYVYIYIYVYPTSQSFCLTACSTLQVAKEFLCNATSSLITEFLVNKNMCLIL